jgi:nitroimidazol reductase NimA-like FMN-containing flavoprotein (pyridoxamine 5'-phosphate oxidase superfamily)
VLCGYVVEPDAPSTPSPCFEASHTRTETAISKIRLDDEEVWALLDERRVGVFTSLRRDGTPISLPVWYAPIRRRVYLHTPPQSKKLARVRNDPRVAFLCETGQRWVDLRAVHLTGTASIVADPSIIQDVSDAFDARYDALRPPSRELPGSARAQYRDFQVIEIEPDARVLSWDNARLMRQEDPTS